MFVSTWKTDDSGRTIAARTFKQTAAKRPEQYFKMAYVWNITEIFLSPIEERKARDHALN